MDTIQRYTVHCYFANGYSCNYPPGRTWFKTKKAAIRQADRHHERTQGSARVYGWQENEDVYRVDRASAAGANQGDAR